MVRLPVMRFLGIYFILAVALAGFTSAIFTQKASAVSGTGYFSGLSTCTTDSGFSGCASAPSTSQNDVISGRTLSNGFEAVPDSALTSKAAFYNWVVGELNGASSRDRLGAAFIINSMVGAGAAGNPAKDSSPSVAMLAEFQQRLYSSNVTMTAPTGSLDPNNYGNGKISFRGLTSSGGQDDVWVTYNAAARPLVIFKNATTGAVVYVLEKPCANPVGGLPGLPNPSATLDPQAVTSAASITLGQSVTLTNRVVTSNTANTRTDSFDWSITSTGANALPGGTGSGSNVQLDPNRTAVNSPYTFTPSAVGTYCRRITISGYPGYAVISGGTTAQACVTVTAGQSATLSAKSNADSSVAAGANFTFIASIDSSNVSGAGADTFTYDVIDGGGTKPMPGGLVVATPSQVAGVNPRVSSSYVFNTNVPGKYCRTIRMTAKPAYAVYAPQTATQCVTVAQMAVFTPTTTTSTNNYEKGSGALSFTHTISVATYPCDSSQANGAVNSTYNWSAKEYGANPIGSTVSGTLEFLNCTNVVRIKNSAGTVIATGAANAASVLLATYNLSAGDISTLDNSTIPKSYSRNTKIDTIEGSAAASAVYEVPYARFYGNDIFATGSGASPSGRIFFGVKATGFDGGGSEYAAIARQLLTAAVDTGISINSRTFRVAANPTEPDGLKAQWNGSGTMPSPSSVMSSLPTTVTANVVAWGADGYYKYDAGVNASLGTANTSKKVTVRADNISITGNITTNIPGGAFDDKTTPVVLLISNGNIYIDSSVDRIDAILLAPSGTIYTCASGFAERPRATWHTNCTTRLTINGAVGAKNVRFARSVGTRLLATADEDAAVGKSPMNASGGSISTAAEVINYPTYLYFASPFLAGNSGVQSLFNAAPLL